MATDDDLDQVLRRWEESDRRSRQRRAVPRTRRWKPRALALASVVVAGACAAAIANLGEERDSATNAKRASAGPPGESRRSGLADSPAFPSALAVRRAWRFARRRGGQVSLAVLDTRGRLRGRDAGRRYVSASVVKAMLLAAELRRRRQDALPLDGTTADLLRAMIVESDNRSADAIYSRVGDPGMLDVARAAGMRRFSIRGYWANAQVTAADLTRFFSRLRKLLPRRQRRAALHLLASITKDQRWGIPRAAGNRWKVHFKGGWRTTGRGELVHQAAWLHKGNRELAVAILTDAQPSRLYAIHTVRGVAGRLLAERTR